MIGISQYSILPFFTATVTLILGIKVYLAKKDSQLHHIFLLWCFCLSLWLYGYSICYSTTNPILADILARYSCTAVFFFSPAFHHFIATFYKLKDELKWVYLGYTIPILSIPIFFYTDLAINGIKHHYFGYYLHAGKLYIFYLLIFFLILGRTMYLIIREIKSGKLDKKKEAQSKFFMFSFFIAYCASVDFLPKYDFEYYPFGSIFILGWVLLTTYAILKHGILDINIIKRSLIYSTFLAILVGIFSIVVILAEKIFQNILGYKTIFGSVISAIIITIIFNPLRNKIQNIVDKYFFKASPHELAEQNELLLKEVSEKERFKKVATLASGMAHEIKNPLTAIKTFSEYLHKHKDDPDFYQKFSKLVGKEVDRIDDLVHQLLEFSKPFPVELKQEDIVKLIDDTLAFLDSQFLRSNITVQKNYLLQTSISITMDPVQIRQVFLNLFINSIDAMPKGGTLTVSITKNKRFVEITTTDTGIGIAKEDLKHIFEPFFTKKENGTGLGLSISYGIIEKHKGKIEVKNTAGVGTEFKIKLPLVRR